MSPAAPLVSRFTFGSDTSASPDRGPSSDGGDRRQRGLARQRARPGPGRRQQRGHRQLAALVGERDRLPSGVGRVGEVVAVHELRGDRLRARRSERPGRGLARVERGGPLRVQVERRGQHPADVVEHACVDQLADMPMGRGRDRLVDLVRRLRRVAAERRLGDPRVVAGRDRVQVRAERLQGRVGPHLVARGESHARTVQPAERRRSAPAVGPRARRGRCWRAGQGPAPSRSRSNPAPRGRPCRARWRACWARTPGSDPGSPRTRRA